MFDELQDFDPFFANFDEPLKDAFRCNFERGMSKFDDERNEDLDTFLCLMSLFFLRYRIVDPENNFYCHFAKLLERLPRVALATLNYDLLLDEALLLEGLAPDWGKTNILKVHGAPNFLVADNLRHAFANNTVGHYQTRVQGAVTIRDPNYSSEYCRDSLRSTKGLVPAMSLYAVGKHVYHSPSFVAGIQTAFVGAVGQASSIVLVGINLNEDDSHIWEAVAKASARVAVVNPDQQQYRDWANRHGREIEFLCDRAEQMVGSHASKLVQFAGGLAD